MNWYTITNDTIVIHVWAKPNAKKSRFVAIDERGIHVAIQAKPDEGKANKALIEFFANQLGMAKKSIQLAKGSKSRLKQVVVNYDERIITKLGDIELLLQKT